MKPDVQPSYPAGIDRLGALIRWTGILAAFGISLSFAAMAAIGFISHDPPSRIALASFFSLASATVAVVRALKPGLTDPTR